jgi:putative phosphoribosyl transferase
MNPEFAVGAVAADGEVVENPSAGIQAEEVRRLAGPAHAKAQHELAVFRSGLPPLDLEGRTAIVVDDGLATGLTALAAVQYLRRVGADRVVLAVPVAPPDTLNALRPYVDELVALETPLGFSAVGQFYTTFGQTEDAEVIALLAQASGRTIS